MEKPLWYKEFLCDGTCRCKILKNKSIKAEGFLMKYNVAMMYSVTLEIVLKMKII